MTRSSLFLFTVLLFLFQSGVSSAALLKLNEYLESVSQNDPVSQSARLSKEGAEDRIVESNLIVLPQFFGSLSWLDDQRETNNPGFLGTRTKSRNFNLGFQETTPFGLAAKFSYDVSEIQIQGTTLLPTPSYTIASPSIEFTTSWWRNIFGSEIRAQQNAAEFGNQANAFAQEFRFKARNSEAEMSYWGLALAREGLEIAKENLERTSKIRAWAQRRAQLNLSDRSDSLQAEALYQLREIEWVQARNDEASARMRFNLVRGRAGDEVPETLEPLEVSANFSGGNFQEKEAAMTTIRSQGTSGSRTSIPGRLDVQAAEAKLVATEALIRQNEERITPTLEFFGKYGWNGYDAKATESKSEAWTSKHPYQLIGIRFVAPLAFGTRNSALNGYWKERQAAEKELHLQRMTAKKDWEELTNKLNETKQKYFLAKQLENIQKEKLAHERVRLDRGRTTTFQWIQFEQDYATARLSRAKILFDLMSIQSQLRLFETSTPLQD